MIQKNDPDWAEALGLTITELEDGTCGIQLGDEVFTPSEVGSTNTRSFPTIWYQSSLGWIPKKLSLRFPPTLTMLNER